MISDNTNNKMIRIQFYVMIALKNSLQVSFEKKYSDALTFNNHDNDIYIFAPLNAIHLMG